MPLPSTAGWPIPSLKPNEVRPVGQLVAVLAPDDLDARQLLVGAARPSRRRPRAGPRRARARRGRRGRRRCRAASPSWPGCSRRRRRTGCARRHPLPELRREAVQRVLRHPERLQALIGEGDGHPGVVGRVGGGRPESTTASSRRTSSRPAARSSIAQQQVGADVGRRPLVQRPALDVVELQADAPAGVSSRRPRPSSVVVLRGLGRVRVRRREVGEAARGRPRGAVDAVADDRPVAGVDRAA